MDDIYIARILYPVRVLGPGDRVGIWFDGCEHHCDGCSNPELWSIEEKYKVSIESVVTMIKSIMNGRIIDGFTITGGDPFYQPDGLLKLLNELLEIKDDILLYTGYSYEDIKDLYPNIIDKITVLIDGKYEKDKNDGSFLRGSNNQKIIVLKEKYKSLYEKYLSSGTNEIQNFSASDGIVSVGIHRAGYREELDEIVKRKGLKEYE